MFNLFRSQKQLVRYLLGGILMLVAISMVITLIPGLGSTPSDPRQIVLAEVDGEPITFSELSLEFRAQAIRPTLPLRSINLSAVNLITKLVDQHVLLMEAEKLGLSTDDQEVADWMQFQLPFLFPNGVFVGARPYQQYVRETFRMSVPEFEESLRRSIIELRLQRVVTANEIVTDAEVEETYRQRRRKVKIEFVKFDSERFLSRAKPSDEQLQQLFESENFRYQLPETRSLKLLRADDTKLPEPEIAEEELKRYYARNRANYQFPERVRTRHILFMTMEKSEEETKELEAKAQEVLKQIQDGADFAELAKEHSDDPASGENGGDLGWVTRGQMDPEFEKGTFALEAGETSDLVKSTFGYHIIRADEKEDPRTRPFAEVQDEVREAVRLQRRSADRTRMLDKLLARAREFGKELEKVGEEYQIPVQTLDAVNPMEPPAVLAGSQELLTAIFAAEEGSPVSHVQEGFTTVAVVTGISPTRPLTFEEARADVLEESRKRESKALASEKAFEVAGEAKKEGGSLKRAASRAGLRVETSRFFTSTEAVEDLGPAQQLGINELDEKTFGEVVGPVPLGEAFVVYRVIDQQEADMLDFDNEKDNLRQTELERKRGFAFGLYRSAIVEQYRQQGKVVVNEPRIQEFVRNYAQGGA
jgi:peptidyl-prolyl cis-trans isomerase D